jgi:hypothetical protein
MHDQEQHCHCRRKSIPVLKEAFPLATPGELEKRLNAKDELVAQSQHSMTERHKQFPISDENAHT